MKVAASQDPSSIARFEVTIVEARRWPPTRSLDCSALRAVLDRGSLRWAGRSSTPAAAVTHCRRQRWNVIWLRAGWSGAAPARLCRGGGSLPRGRTGATPLCQGSASAGSLSVGEHRPEYSLGAWIRLGRRARVAPIGPDAARSDALVGSHWFERLPWFAQCRIPTPQQDTGRTAYRRARRRSTPTGGSTIAALDRFVSVPWTSGRRSAAGGPWGSWEGVRGPSGDRTQDQRVKSPVLCQLS